MNGNLFASISKLLNNPVASLYLYFGSYIHIHIHIHNHEKEGMNLSFKKTYMQFFLFHAIVRTYQPYINTYIHTYIHQDFILSSTMHCQLNDTYIHTYIYQIWSIENWHLRIYYIHTQMHTYIHTYIHTKHYEILFVYLYPYFRSLLDFL